MTVVYKGELEEMDSGCIPCGTKRKGKYAFVNSKDYFLPSGKNVQFHRGVPVTVSQRDGEFLLEYIYKDANGSIRPVFEEVK